MITDSACSIETHREYFKKWRKKYPVDDQLYNNYLKQEFIYTLKNCDYNFDEIIKTMKIMTDNKVKLNVGLFKRINKECKHSKDADLKAECNGYYGNIKEFIFQFIKRNTSEEESDNLSHIAKFNGINI
jgi:hypothetical protein